MKSLLILSVSSLLVLGCSKSGFTASNQMKIEALPAGTEVTSTFFNEKDLKGGQPGSIYLSGAFAQGNSAPAEQIKITQIAGKNPSGAVDKEIGSVSKVKIEPVDSSLLFKIQERNDFVQIGCSSSNAEISKFTQGMGPGKSILESKHTLQIKAKVVALCNKVNLPQSFVTITADHIVMLNFDYQISKLNAVGAFAIAANRVTLIGANQIRSLGQDSSGILIDGPAIFLAADKELAGKGTLEVKSFGGNQLQAGSK